MKSLKFAKPLPNLILRGEKTTTWRINDDKNLSENDKIILLDASTKEEFSKAIITHVKETTFGNLTHQDWEGHEKFESEEEMYKTYSKYYSCEITPETPLKIIKFKLLK